MNQLSGKTIALIIAILFVLLSGIVGVGAVVRGLQEVREKGPDSDRPRTVSTTERTATVRKTATTKTTKKQTTKPPTRKADGSKVIYLTFDDGPSDNTLKILEILKKYVYRYNLSFFNYNMNMSYMMESEINSQAQIIENLIKKYAKIRFNRFWSEWGISKEELGMFAGALSMFIIPFALYIFGCMF